MPEKAIPEIQNNDFAERIGKLSNEQLIECLRKRELYQKEASQAAIQEAKKRGLIQSDEDLLTPHFQPVSLKKKLVPDIEDPKTRVKIRKSIIRSLLIAGLVPVIRGIMEINAGLTPEGLAILAFGLIWIGAAAWMFRKLNPVPIVVLFSMTALSLVYFLFFSGFRLEFTDWFILTALYLLIVYGLIFLLKLSK